MIRNAVECVCLPGRQPRRGAGIMPSYAPFAPLATPRLALVALRLEHVPAVFAYANDPDISRLVVWPRHETLADSRRFVAHCLVGYAKGDLYEWGLGTAIRPSISRHLRLRYAGPSTWRGRGRLCAGEALLAPRLRHGGCRRGASFRLHRAGPAADRSPGMAPQHRLVTRDGQARPALSRDRIMDTTAEMPEPVGVYQIARHQW